MTNFIPRDFDYILGQIAAQAAAGGPETTDLNRGSRWRTLIESVAAAGAAQDAVLVAALVESIPAAAYRALADFQPDAGSKSYGTVLLKLTSAPGSTVTIAAGRTFRVPGTQRLYSTSTAYTVTAGSAAPVELVIIAAAAGSLYNTPANTITEMIGTISGLSVGSITNKQPLTTGTDDEGAEAIRSRFASFLESKRRATGGALEGAARSVRFYTTAGQIGQRVTRAKAVTTGPGTATLYIHNGDPAGATIELINRVQQVVDGYADGVTGVIYEGYKAAGDIVVTTSAALINTVVNPTVTVLPTFDPTLVTQNVRAACYAVIAGREIGQSLYLWELTAAARLVPGVQNVSIVTSPTMSGDVLAANSNQVITGPAVS